MKGKVGDNRAYGCNLRQSNVYEDDFPFEYVDAAVR